MKHISSTGNALIRKIEQWQRKSRARIEDGVFVVEGKREIMLSQKGNYQFKTILICEEIDTDALRIAQDVSNDTTDIITVTATVYNKLAYRGNTEGILAVVQSKSYPLEASLLPKNPLILIAEAPEKPGNIGALLRTADAAGVDLFILANPITDLYNPNVIRSAVGCVFTVPIATGTTRDIIDFLRKQNINLFAATLQNSNSYTEQNFTHPTAIAVGTEATGLSQEWRDAAKQNIIIPMHGAIDSMNVSVSAAILIYEAVRQRV